MILHGFYSSCVVNFNFQKCPYCTTNNNRYQTDLLLSFWGDLYIVDNFNVIQFVLTIQSFHSFNIKLFFI